MNETGTTCHALIHFSLHGVFHDAFHGRKREERREIPREERCEERRENALMVREMDWGGDMAVPKLEARNAIIGAWPGFAFSRSRERSPTKRTSSSATVSFD